MHSPILVTAFNFPSFLLCVWQVHSSWHAIFLEDNKKLVKLSLVISEKQNHGFWSKVGGKAS